MVRLNNLLYPTITFAVLFTVWYVAVRTLDVPAYLFPSPEAVVRSLWVGLVRTGALYPHIFATLQVTLYGYLIGCGLGILVAILLADLPIVEKFIHPLIVSLQSIPKVAIAPLLIVWFGHGVTSKVVTVALISFFPVFVNTLNGLRSANPDLIDLYRVFSAGRLKVMLHVKLPSAGGAIFSGLQIAVVLALIGAIVAEFLSSQRGLGNVIQASQVSLDVANIFGAVLLLALFGTLFSSLLRYLQAKIIFWEAPLSKDFTKR